MLVVETESPVRVVVAGATTVVVTAVTTGGASVCTVVELTVSLVTSVELISVVEPPAEIDQRGAAAGRQRARRGLGAEADRIRRAARGGV